MKEKRNPERATSNCGRTPGKVRFAATLFCLAILVSLFCAACSKPPALPPDAERYNQYARAVDLSKQEQELADLVRQWAREVQREPPTLDGGLTYACRSLALRLKSKGASKVTDVTNKEIQAELVRFGVPDSAIRTQMLVGSLLIGVNDEMRGTVREELTRGHYTHFGIGAVRTMVPPLLITALVLSRRPIGLDPFPKAVEVGERIELSGRLLEGLNEPTVFLSPPSGRVFETLLNVSRDGSFRTSIFFGHGAGLYRVEISGVGSSGPEIAALMPVQVGGAEPTAPETPLPPERDEAEARRLVLARINREREQAGLAALQEYPQLDRVAQSHAEEMRRLGFAAHRSPTTGMASDRATAAGIRWSRITENVAVNQTALTAHDSLMESPAHRANVLDAQVVYVGIGVSFGDGGHGQRVVFLVENYLALQQNE